MLRPIALPLALAFLLGPSSAFPQEVNVAGQRLNIALPRGYCLARESGSEGAVVHRIATGVGPRNRLIAVFAKCDVLAESRASSPSALDGFDDYGTVVTPLTDGVVVAIEGANTSEFVRLVSAQLVNGDQSVLLEGMKRAEKRIRELRPGDQKVENLGLVAVDDNAAYLGVTMTQSLPDQRLTNRSIGIAAITLVRKLRLYVTHYRTYEGPSSLPQLLEQQKATLGLLVAANAR